MFKKVNLVDVPKKLHTVTDIDTQSEVSPYDVGMTRDGVEAIWNSVEGFYKTGLQPGLGMTIRRHGEIVLNRAIGHRTLERLGNQQYAAEQSLLKTDTPVCLFSASKAITAMLVHKLHEEGKINLNEKVASYIPEFACNGKEDITLSMVLSHRAGIPVIPMTNPHPSLLFKWDSVIDLINSAHTGKGDGSQQAYHAIVGGYVLGEVIQRVTGKSVNDYLLATISKPLNAKYLSYGLKPSDHQEAAHNYSTGAPPAFPINVLAKRALNIDFEKVAAISNTTEFMNSVVPAGNIYGTADDVSRFYQMMLDQGQFNGQQVFQPETIKRAVKPVSKLTLDKTLMIPMRFSEGFMLGENLFSLFGVKARKAFGHLGLINIVSWADPSRDISVSFLNTGKSLDPRTLPALGKVLISVSRNCSTVSK